MPDWQRYTRIVGSFLITAACYTVYAAGVAPLIEPPRPHLPPGQIPDDTDKILGERSAKRQEWLGHWFGKDDWEWTAPLTLETPQGTLLFDEYVPRDDGLVEIRPCTMVLTSAGPNETELEPEQYRRAIVIRAPQGALLRFDSPIDLRQSTIGKLVGGELLGDVEIRSGQRHPGPEDDLLITTRNVALNQTEITTPELMEFRFGPHYGRGRGVQIVLDAAQTEIGAGPRGVRELNLLEQVFVHIEPSSGNDLFPGAAPMEPKTATAPAPQPAGDSAPVEVRSTGRFTFDFVENYALFRKQVDVVRLHADGKLDQMNGDLLKIIFEKATTPEAAVAADGKDPKRSNKLEPRRIEFSGEPVVIRAPAEEMQARAQYVEHDLITRSVRLRDAVEVIIRRQDHELRAPEIFYLPDNVGGYGTFQAAGRGSLSGSSPDDPQQAFQAEWTTRLHFRRHEDRQVLSMHGAARFEAVGKGALAGDEIHLWLKEVPKADPNPAPSAGEKPKTELVPDRLLALSQVKIQSPQLTGAVNRLEGWFEQEATRAVAHRVHFAPEAGVFAPQPAAAAALPPQFMPLPDVDAAAKPLEPERQFHIDGDVLRLRMAVVGKEMQLREAVVERGVKVIETKTKSPTEKPLLLQGDLLHVVQPTPTESHVVVTGSPAYVEAQELTVSGGKLVLDRPNAETNHVGVDGQGVLTMPVDRDLQGRAIATREVLHLSWQGGMMHNGKTAVFQRGVEARLSSQNLRTDRLEVIFTERPKTVVPTQADAAAQEIAQVKCFDGVQIESRSTTPDGNPLAIERLEARTLTVDQRTGDFSAEGPGEVTSFRLGTPGGAMLQGQPQPAAAANGANGQPAPAAEKKINYLQVRFQRQLIGNHPRREMTFINQVRTLYGPVPDWARGIDPNQPTQWSPETVQVDCEKMQVLARTDVAAATETFDLIAEGNTLVEGTTFNARSPRLTYTQSKDMLVIEGDGRNDAVLYHQERPGADTSVTSAQRFMIWPKTNRVQIDGATSLELK